MAAFSCLAPVKTSLDLRFTEKDFTYRPVCAILAPVRNEMKLRGECPCREKT